jgi:hypothetical protein
LRAFSDSRMRRSRACWRVEIDSETRDTASLSGWMLKLLIVWLISWRRGQWEALRAVMVGRTVAGSSERSILSVAEGVSLGIRTSWVEAACNDCQSARRDRGCVEFGVSRSKHGRITRTTGGGLIGYPPAQTSSLWRATGKPARLSSFSHDSDSSASISKLSPRFDFNPVILPIRTDPYDLSFPFRSYTLVLCLKTSSRTFDTKHHGFRTSL